MKAALIHFELWFLNEKNYEHDDLYEIRFHIAMNQIKENIKKNNIDTIVGEVWADGWAYNHNDNWYDFLKRIETASRKIGIKNFYLGVGQCHDYQEELEKRNLNYKIIDFYWPVQEIVNSYRRLDKINDIKDWNSDTGKFFIPGGVPARPKRIGLLSKFYDAGMLEKAEWSFFPPWTTEDKQWSRKYLHRYTEQQYNDFIEYCTREIDPVYKQIHHYSRMSGPELVKQKIFEQPWWSIVGYLDNKVFNSTSLSVVNEGPGDDTRFLTEKLWLTILNKHPFILVDTAERYQYCKDLGLRMFEDYVKIKDYGFIEDPEQQMDAVIENTQYFLQNINQNKDDIQKDIEHNLKIFYKYVLHNEQHKNFLENFVVDRNIHKYFEDIHLGTYISIPKISEISRHVE